MLALALLAFITLATAQTAGLFSSVQSGQGTYYGGNPGGGACSNSNPAPSWVAANGMTMVAMNANQFAGGGQSLGCGMCVQIVGTGSGSGGNPITGTYLAYVNDLCPECPVGNIDFGTSGDGRWNIQWKAVNCPVGSTQLSYLWQGSNVWYVKVQVQSSAVPVQTFEIARHGSGDYRQAQKTSDNFWQCPGCAYPLTFPLDVRATSVHGEVVLDQISAGITTYAAQGLGVQFTGFTGYSPSISPSPAPPAPAPPAPLPPPALPVPAPIPPPSSGSPWAIYGVSLQAGGTSIPSGSGNGFYVNVNYGALVTAEIVIDILDTNGWSWYGGGSVSNIAPGSGTVSVYVTVRSNIPYVGTIAVKPWIVAQTDAGDYANAPAQLFWPVAVY